MSRFVRPSKYRHVYGEKAKAHYDNVKISGSAWDTDLISASAKYLAVNWQVAGGGAIGIVPAYSPFTAPHISDFQMRLPDLMPLARGHTAPVLDTAWSPFDDGLLASGGDDGKIFIWKIDDSIFEGWGEDGWEAENLQPATKMDVAGRRVGQVFFHPTASSLLTSASADHLIRIWDIEKGLETPAITLKDHKETIQSLCWNSVGTLLATTSRDKKLRLFDPRAGTEAVRTADSHPGVKGSRVVWLGDRDRIATTGFSKMSDRELSLWDTSSLKSLNTESIDTSSGVLMPFFVEGNDLLFLAGKGDGNIRYYEYENDSIHFLNEYKSSDPQRGMTFAPRRALEVHQTEIGRSYKLASGMIEALSWIVPRRAEDFQSDLFPPANSIEPALTAQEWIDGKNARPNVIDLKTHAVSSSSAPISSTPSKSSTPATSTPAPKAAETPAPAPAPPAESATPIPAPADPSPTPTPKEEAPAPKEKGDEAKEAGVVAATVAAVGGGAAVVAETAKSVFSGGQEEKESPKEKDKPKEDAKSLEIEQPDSEDEASPPAAESAKSPTVPVGSSSASGVSAPKDHLLIKKLSDKATLPTRGSALSAGYDLYSAEESTVPAKGKALIDLQISIACPEGTYGRVAPRSGLASKHSIDTGAGVIDADYRGPVKVLLYNFSDEDFTVKHGDRVAQLILERVAMAPLLEVDDLEVTTRGSGGFGSTGGFGK